MHGTALAVIVYESAQSLPSGMTVSGLWQKVSFQPGSIGSC